MKPPTSHGPSTLTITLVISCLQIRDPKGNDRPSRSQNPKRHGVEFVCTLWWTLTKNYGKTPCYSWENPLSMVIFHSTLLVYQRVFVLFRIHLRLEINRGCRELCCVSSNHKECLLFETISLEIKSITHRISWWCCREIDITRYKLCKLNVPIQTPACFILAGTTSFFDPFDGWNCMFAAKKRHLLNHLNHVQLIQTHSNSRWKWWNHVKPIHFCWFFPPCYHLFLGEGLSALHFFLQLPMWHLERPARHRCLRRNFGPIQSISCIIRTMWGPQDS